MIGNVNEINMSRVSVNSVLVLEDGLRRGDAVIDHGTLSVNVPLYEAF